MSRSVLTLAALVFAPAALAAEQSDLQVYEACYTDGGAAVQADGFASRGLVTAHDATIVVHVDYDLEQVCGIEIPRPIRRTIRVTRQVTREELADVTVHPSLNPAGRTRGYLWAAEDVLDVGSICLIGQTKVSELTVLGVSMEIGVEDGDGETVLVDDDQDGSVIGEPVGQTLTLSACAE